MRSRSRGIGRAWSQQCASAAVSVLVLIVSVAGAVTTPGVVPEPQEREYELKARFLFNFTQFVTWPPSAFPNGSSPFVVAVLGDDPFGTALDDAFRDASVAGRPVRVVRVSWNDDLRRCHVVFVRDGQTSQAERLDRLLGDAPILTVGDDPAFASAGGVIGFRLQNNRVRFDINPSAARRHGLVLASQLLELARVVGK